MTQPLLSGDGCPPQKFATGSEHRENRVRLKRELLKEY
jgi:hypothetical protein